MTLKKTALTLALALGMVAGANAANYTVATGSGVAGAYLAGDDFYSGASVSVGKFFDTWSFTIGEILGSSGTVSNAFKTGSKNITGLTVDLYQGTFGDIVADQHLATLLTTGVDRNLQAWGEGVYPSAGNYYYTIQGFGTGTSGGGYSIAVTTAPVPEPETYAMLLVGLGLMGTIARRRNRAKPR